MAGEAEAVMTDFLAFGSGGLVGFILGLIGGGGSILAVPLLVYVVGVAQPHIAIGTGALAVGLSAAGNLVQHARARNVKWRCAGVFAAAGVIGALIGSTLGKAFDGQKLLLLFGVVMIIIAGAMAYKKSTTGNPAVKLTSTSAAHLLPRLLGYGLATGALSGFFGIGGGFLVVPGLMAATDMPIIAAVGSSLLSVMAFGLTTAASYAYSGLIDWRLAAIFIAGGIAGGFVGTRTATRFSTGKDTLRLIFAGIVAIVGAYVVARSAMAVMSGG
jgi:uncharacterized membrane protein YfcA